MQVPPESKRVLQISEPACLLKMEGDMSNGKQSGMSKVERKAFNGVLGLRNGIGAAGRLALENNLGERIGKKARHRNKAFG